MKSSFVTCAVCGHRYLTRYVRERGMITCRCGLRIAHGSLAQPRQAHPALRSLVFLFGTALLIAVAGTLAHRFLN